MGPEESSPGQLNRMERLLDEVRSSTAEIKGELTHIRPVLFNHGLRISELEKTVGQYRGRWSVLAVVTGPIIGAVLGAALVWFTKVAG